MGDLNCSCGVCEKTGLRESRAVCKVLQLPPVVTFFLFVSNFSSCQDPALFASRSSFEREYQILVPEGVGL